eukprot:scaffold121681_cov16-Prasinocladus_malaysianus.AAC.1
MQDKTLIKDYAREIAAMCKIRHPNVVAFMGAGISPPRCIDVKVVDARIETAGQKGAAKADPYLVALDGSDGVLGRPTGWPPVLVLEH